jgi:hypothetical protein
MEILFIRFALCLPSGPAVPQSYNQPRRLKYM